MSNALKLLEQNYNNPSTTDSLSSNSSNDNNKNSGFLNNNSDLNKLIDQVKVSSTPGVTGGDLNEKTTNISSYGNIFSDINKNIIALSESIINNPISVNFQDPIFRNNQEKLKGSHEFLPVIMNLMQLSTIPARILLKRAGASYYDKHLFLLTNVQDLLRHIYVENKALRMNAGIDSAQIYGGSNIIKDNKKNKKEKDFKEQMIKTFSVHLAQENAKERLTPDKITALDKILNFHSAVIGFKRNIQDFSFKTGITEKRYTSDVLKHVGFNKTDEEKANLFLSNGLPYAMEEQSGLLTQIHGSLENIEELTRTRLSLLLGQDIKLDQTKKQRERMRYDPMSGQFVDEETYQNRYDKRKVVMKELISMERSLTRKALVNFVEHFLPFESDNSEKVARRGMDMIGEGGGGYASRDSLAAKAFKLDEKKETMYHKFAGKVIGPAALGLGAGGLMLADLLTTGGLGSVAAGATIGSSAIPASAIPFMSTILPAYFGSKKIGEKIQNTGNLEKLKKTADAYGGDTKEERSEKNPLLKKILGILLKGGLAAGIGMTGIPLLPEAISGIAEAGKAGTDMMGFMPALLGGGTAAVMSSVFGKGAIGSIKGLFKKNRETDEQSEITEEDQSGELSESIGEQSLFEKKDINLTPAVFNKPLRSILKLYGPENSSIVFSAGTMHNLKIIKALNKRMIDVLNNDYYPKEEIRLLRQLNENQYNIWYFSENIFKEIKKGFENIELLLIDSSISQIDIFEQISDKNEIIINKLQELIDLSSTSNLELSNLNTGIVGSRQGRSSNDESINTDPPSPVNIGRVSQRGSSNDEPPLVAAASTGGFIQNSGVISFDQLNLKEKDYVYNNNDTVPVNLSEGEVVIPSDMVQKYGLSFFKDIVSGVKSASIEEKVDKNLSKEISNAIQSKGINKGNIKNFVGKIFESLANIEYHSSVPNQIADGLLQELFNFENFNKKQSLSKKVTKNLNLKINSKLKDEELFGDFVENIFKLFSDINISSYQENIKSSFEGLITELFDFKGINQKNIPFFGLSLSERITSNLYKKIDNKLLEENENLFKKSVDNIFNAFDDIDTSNYQENIKSSFEGLITELFNFKGINEKNIPFFGLSLSERITNNLYKKIDSKLLEENENLFKKSVDNIFNSFDDIDTSNYQENIKNSFGYLITELFNFKGINEKNIPFFGLSLSERITSNLYKKIDNKLLEESDNLFENPVNNIFKLLNDIDISDNQENIKNSFEYLITELFNFKGINEKNIPFIGKSLSERITNSIKNSLFKYLTGLSSDSNNNNVLDNLKRTIGSYLNNNVFTYDFIDSIEIKKFYENLLNSAFDINNQRTDLFISQYLSGINIDFSLDESVKLKLDSDKISNQITDLSLEKIKNYLNEDFFFEISDIKLNFTDSAKAQTEHEIFSSISSLFSSKIRKEINKIQNIITIHDIVLRPDENQLNNLITDSISSQLSEIEIPSINLNIDTSLTSENINRYLENKIKEQIDKLSTSFNVDINSVFKFQFDSDSNIIEFGEVIDNIKKSIVEKISGMEIGLGNHSVIPFGTYSKDGKSYLTIIKEKLVDSISNMEIKLGTNNKLNITDLINNIKSKINNFDFINIEEDTLKFGTNFTEENPLPVNVINFQDFKEKKEKGRIITSDNFENINFQSRGEGGSLNKKLKSSGSDIDLTPSEFSYALNNFPIYNLGSGGEPVFVGEKGKEVVVPGADSFQEALLNFNSGLVVSEPSMVQGNGYVLSNNFLKELTGKLNFKKFDSGGNTASIGSDSIQQNSKSVIFSINSQLENIYSFLVETRNLVRNKAILTGLLTAAFGPLGPMIGQAAGEQISSMISGIIYAIPHVIQNTKLFKILTGDIKSIFNRKKEIEKTNIEKRSMGGIIGSGPSKPENSPIQILNYDDSFFKQLKSVFENDNETKSDRLKSMNEENRRDMEMSKEEEYRNNTSELLSSMNEKLGEVSKKLHNEKDKGLLQTISGIFKKLIPFAGIVGGGLLAYKSFNDITSGNIPSSTGPLISYATKFTAGLFKTLFQKIGNIAPAIVSNIFPTAKTISSGISGGGIGGIMASLSKIGVNILKSIGLGFLFSPASAKAAGFMSKALGKSIPGLGIAVGVGFAIKRVREGDYIGALLELAGGVLGSIPGFGLPFALSISGILAIRDMMKSGNEEPEQENMTEDGQGFREKLGSFLSEVGENISSFITNRLVSPLGNVLAPIFNLFIKGEDHNKLIAKEENKIDDTIDSFSFAKIFEDIGNMLKNKFIELKEKIFSVVDNINPFASEEKRKREEIQRQLETKGSASLGGGITYSSTGEGSGSINVSSKQGFGQLIDDDKRREIGKMLGLSKNESLSLSDKEGNKIDPNSVDYGLNFIEQLISEHKIKERFKSGSFKNIQENIIRPDNKNYKIKTSIINNENDQKMGQIFEYSGSPQLLSLQEAAVIAEQFNKKKDEKGYAIEEDNGIYKIKKEYSGKNSGWFGSSIPDKLKEPKTIYEFVIPDEIRREQGGPVERGKPYLVGEKGKPELMVPEENGRVVSLNEINSWVTQILNRNGEIPTTETDALYKELRENVNRLNSNENPSISPQPKSQNISQNSNKYNKLGRLHTLSSEGISLTSYPDADGHSVGVGHYIKPGEEHLKNGKVDYKTIKKLFDEDYSSHVEAAKNIPGYDKIHPAGKRALEDITFNIGPGWINKFNRMRKALKKGDYFTAAKELLDSKYADQVGVRAIRNAGLILTGDPSFFNSNRPMIFGGKDKKSKEDIDNITSFLMNPSIKTFKEAKSLDKSLIPDGNKFKSILSGADIGDIDSFDQLASKVAKSSGSSAFGKLGKSISENINKTEKNNPITIPELDMTISSSKINEWNNSHPDNQIYNDDGSINKKALSTLTTSIAVSRSGQKSYADSNIKMNESTQPSTSSSSSPSVVSSNNQTSGNNLNSGSSAPSPVYRQNFSGTDVTKDIDEKPQFTKINPDFDYIVENMFELTNTYLNGRIIDYSLKSAGL